MVARVRLDTLLGCHCRRTGPLSLSVPGSAFGGRRRLALADRCVKTPPCIRRWQRSDFLPHELRSPVSHPKTCRGVGLGKSFASQNLSPIGHSPPGTVPENNPQDCFRRCTFLASFKSPSPPNEQQKNSRSNWTGNSLLACRSEKDI